MTAVLTSIHATLDNDALKAQRIAYNCYMSIKDFVWTKSCLPFHTSKASILGRKEQCQWNRWKEFLIYQVLRTKSHLKEVVQDEDRFNASYLHD